MQEELWFSILFLLTVITTDVYTKQYFSCGENQPHCFVLLLYPDEAEISLCRVFNSVKSYDLKAFIRLTRQVKSSKLEGAV